jgi:N-acetylglucosaminyl-diphospho-decaprenol L-rhamnosyltransferase
MASTTLLDLTVAVVSYNSGPVIIAGLADVMRSQRFNVVVVDNHSSNNSVALLRDTFPGLNVVALDKNLGYGRAANVAIWAAETRYVLILNPDIVVTADNIVAFFEAAQAVAGQASIFAPATSANECNEHGWQPVRNVLGAVMLLDTHLLHPVGFFDEQLFLFYEETDLCLRVIESGGKILRHGGFRFHHDKGTSSGESPHVTFFKQWHVGWSSAYYLRKHGLDKGRMRLGYLAWRYWLKRWLSGSAAKREKYRARLGGLSAYMQGLNAFDEKGEPRRLEVLLAGD